MRLLEHLIANSEMDIDWSALVPVDATEVAEWAYSDERLDSESATYDLPILSPFDCAWFEYLPSDSFRRIGAREGVLPKRIGWLVAVRERDENGIALQYARCFNLLRLAGRGRDEYIHYGDVEEEIDADGRAIPESVRTRLFAQNETPTDEERRLTEHWFDRHFRILRFTLSLLHCKNVRIEEGEPIPEKVARKRAAAGHNPGIRFRRVVVDAFKGRPAVRSLAPGEGKRAAHIARGHFATYTPERPLFGRVAGTFWIPMHVRGSKEHGEIKKDYRVKAPKAQVAP